MSAPTADDIFDFLAEKRSDRVSEAVRRPGRDPEADEALVRFRKDHQDLMNMPGVAAAVEGFWKSWQVPVAVLVRDLPMAQEIVEPRRTTWRDLFDRLLAYCRAELARDPATPVAAGTPQSLVSTALSSYIRGIDAGRYGDLHDERQLWPVLLEIVAKKLKMRLTPQVAATPKFAEKLGAILDRAVESVSTDRRRLIIVHTLLGKDPDQIERETRTRAADVRNVVRSMHAKLQAFLSA